MRGAGGCSAHSRTAPRQGVPLTDGNQAHACALRGKRGQGQSFSGSREQFSPHRADPWFLEAGSGGISSLISSVKAPQCISASHDQTHLSSGFPCTSPSPAPCTEHPVPFSRHSLPPPQTPSPPPSSPCSTLWWSRGFQVAARAAGPWPQGGLWGGGDDAHPSVVLRRIREVSQCSGETLWVQNSAGKQGIQTLPPSCGRGIWLALTERLCPANMKCPCHLASPERGDWCSHIL